jgi:hypothetical protein
LFFTYFSGHICENLFSVSKFVCLIQSACEVYIDVKAHSCIYKCFLSARFQHFISVILCCWTKLSDYTPTCSVQIEFHTSLYALNQNYFCWNKLIGGQLIIIDVCNFDGEWNLCSYIMKWVEKAECHYVSRFSLS